MAVPDFVVELRRHIGHDPLWLVATTAVVLRPRAGGGEEVLFVQRADNGRWTPVTGVVDPGEHPGDTCVRECLEETRVEIRVERLVMLSVTELKRHVNGDLAQYCDLTFRCRWVAGAGEVGDDESTQVVWYPTDALPAMPEALAARVRAAIDDLPECRLVTGERELPVVPAAGVAGSSRVGASSGVAGSSDD